ncbi:ABC transporter permease [Candidatus Microgenomates bacterium]|nr:MAG: ABC transporter permease [Candidatus Microgenomates bacterium]
MINFNRIYAMAFRHLINMRHNFDRLSDMFYWPVMDLLLWGLTGLYFVKTSPNTPNILFVMLSGLVFWIVLWRAQYEITTNLLSEFWDKNLVNIFVAPLTVAEWIITFMVFGLIKTLISLLFSSLVAYMLYRYNLFQFGFYIIPFILSLILTGWAGGFFVSAFIIRYGINLQTLAWAGIYLMAPFSAIYYPISVLPSWAQAISKVVPSSYIFEGIREILFTGRFSYDKLFVSFGLNIIYLTFSIWFFIFMFNKSRKLGLGRLI